MLSKSSITAQMNSEYYVFFRQKPTEHQEGIINYSIVIGYSIEEYQKTNSATKADSGSKEPLGEPTKNVPFRQDKTNGGTAQEVKILPDEDSSSIMPNKVGGTAQEVKILPDEDSSSITPNKVGGTAQEFNNIPLELITASQIDANKFGGTTQEFNIPLELITASQIDANKFGGTTQEFNILLEPITASQIDAPPEDDPSIILKLKISHNNEGGKYEILYPISPKPIKGDIPVSQNRKKNLCPIQENDLPVIAKCYLLAEIHLAREQLRQTLVRYRRLPTGSVFIDMKQASSSTIEKLENHLAKCKNKIINHPIKKWITIFLITVALTALLLSIWSLTPPSHPSWKLILPDWAWSEIASTIYPKISIIACSLLIGAGLIIAINPRTFEENDTKKTHEELSDSLDKIKSKITQANLAVAAVYIEINTVSEEKISPQNDTIHSEQWLRQLDDTLRLKESIVSEEKISPQNDTIHSEQWLRQLDDTLRLKESIVSIEKIIAARQRDVGNIMREIEAGKKKSSRAIASSVGALAAGFITYEIGSAIKYLIQIGNGQDPISYGYWLEAIVQHGSAPGSYDQIVKKTETGKIECDTIANLALQEQKDTLQASINPIPSGSGHQGTITHSSPTESQTPAGNKTVQECLQNHLREHYQQPEMLAQAILLTAVLIVSTVAALIAWRKGTDGE